jgi:hypothetical protein
MLLRSRVDTLVELRSEDELRERDEPLHVDEGAESSTAK